MKKLLTIVGLLFSLTAFAQPVSSTITSDGSVVTVATPVNSKSIPVCNFNWIIVDGYLRLWVTGSNEQVPGGRLKFFTISGVTDNNLKDEALGAISDQCGGGGGLDSLYLSDGTLLVSGDTLPAGNGIYGGSGTAVENLDVKFGSSNIHMMSSFNEDENAYIYKVGDNDVSLNGQGFSFVDYGGGFTSSEIKSTLGNDLTQISMSPGSLSIGAFKADTSGSATLLFDNVTITSRNGEGFEYINDYSSTIRTNSRSIPDVGTVELMIDSLGGGGIYGGDGIAPADVDVTVTDSINFDAGTLFLDGVNNRVGIGIVSPKMHFHLSATSLPYNHMTNNESGHNSTDGLTLGLVDTGNGGPYAFLRLRENYPLDFWTSDVIRMRISSTGLIGIGTTSPDRLLHTEVSDAVTNAVTYTSRESHITSGTATTGFGVGKEWELENGSGTPVVAASEEITWSDATNGSEDATYRLKLERAGVLAEALNVNSTGRLTVASNFTLTGGDINVGGSAQIAWSARLRLDTPSDGVMRVTDAAGTSFNRLQFGGTGPGFPSLKRSGTGLVVRLADDSADAPITASNLLSGTYTPTITNITNVDSAYASPAQYMRVGNVVTVSGYVTVDPTASASTEIAISLPIASNFANDYECAGMAVANGVTNGECAPIYGDSTNNRASMAWETSITFGNRFYYTFTYQII